MTPKTIGTGIVHSTMLSYLRPLVSRLSSSRTVFRQLSSKRNFSSKDWGLDNDGSRANIHSSNLFSSNPQITHSTHSHEEEWRKLNTSDSSSDTSSLSPEIRKKKLKWSATKRGWTECGEFLISFVEDGGLDKLDTEQDITEMERLLKTDDMFLMAIVWGSKETPDELNNNALQALREFSDRKEYV